MNKQLINQIRSELRFLKSSLIKDLVHEADLGCCHEESFVINDRIKILEKKLKVQLNATKRIKEE